jgi:AcrR family transcriptional regulator
MMKKSNPTEINVCSQAYLDALSLDEHSGVIQKKRANAFLVAREWVRAGRKLDLVLLSDELGVGRATLYRWVGDKERLLADVMWDYASSLYENVLPKAKGKGKALLQDGIRLFMEGLATYKPLRLLLANDNELAMRILTRRQGTGVQERAVNLITQSVLGLEMNGEYCPKMPANLLAYSVVRIIEGFIYSDISSGLEPDLEGAELVISHLL